MENSVVSLGYRSSCLQCVGQGSSFILKTTCHREAHLTPSQYSIPASIARISLLSVPSRRQKPFVTNVITSIAKEKRGQCDLKVEAERRESFKFVTINGASFTGSFLAAPAFAASALAEETSSLDLVESVENLIEPVLLLNGSTAESLEPVEDTVKSFAKTVLSDAEAAQSSIESLTDTGVDVTSEMIDAVKGPGLEAENIPVEIDAQDVTPDAGPLTTVQERVSNAIESVKASFEEAVDSGKESVSNFVDSITGASTESFSSEITEPEVLEAPGVMESSGTTTVDAGAAVEEVTKEVTSPLKSAADRYRDLLGSGGTTPSPPEEKVFTPDSDPLTSAQETLNNTIESVKSSFVGAVDSGKESVSNFIDSITGSIRSSGEAFNSSVESSKEAVGGAVGDVAKQLGLPPLPPLPPLPSPPPIPRVDVPPEVIEAGGAVFNAVRLAAGAASVQLGQAAAQVYFAAKEQLPPEIVSGLEVVEEKVEEYSGPTSAFLKEALLKFGTVANSVFRAAEIAVGLDPDDPLIAPVALSIVLVGSAGISIIIYQRAQAAGYSGDLTPEESLELLREEFDALLLDIRPQALRDQDGIPDLRRGARFKDAAVEFYRVSDPVKGLVTNADEVDQMIMASKVRGLKGVGTGSKVVVMDDTGSGESREVARGLRKYGGFGKSYRMSGGYQAWANTYRTKPDTPESIVTLLKQEAEAFVEEVRPTPLGVAAVVAGFVLAGYAVTEWEKSLQLLGIVGVGRMVYLRFQSYDSIEDVKSDILFLLRPLTLVAAGAIWVGGLIDGKDSKAGQLSTVPPVYDAVPEDENLEGENEESQTESSDKTVSETVSEAASLVPSLPSPEPEASSPLEKEKV